jgi:hypothetical protein
MFLVAAVMQVHEAHGKRRSRTGRLIEPAGEIAKMIGYLQKGGVDPANGRICKYGVSLSLLPLGRGKIAPAGYRAVSERPWLSAC